MLRKYDSKLCHRSRKSVRLIKVVTDLGHRGHLFLSWLVICNLRVRGWTLVNLSISTEVTMNNLSTSETLFSHG